MTDEDPTVIGIVVSDSNMLGILTIVNCHLTVILHYAELTYHIFLILNISLYNIIYIRKVLHARLYT
jgi:hypothetical protein